jgi:hypothetical protein
MDGLLAIKASARHESFTNAERTAYDGQFGVPPSECPRGQPVHASARSDKPMGSGGRHVWPWHDVEFGYGSVFLVFSREACFSRFSGRQLGVKVALKTFHGRSVWVVRRSDIILCNGGVVPSTRPRLQIPLALAR